MEKLNVRSLKTSKVARAQKSLKSAGNGIERHRARTTLWRAQRELAAWEEQ